ETGCTAGDNRRRLLRAAATAHSTTSAPAGAAVVNPTRVAHPRPPDPPDQIAPKRNRRALPTPGHDQDAAGPPAASRPVHHPSAARADTLRHAPKTRWRASAVPIPPTPRARVRRRRDVQRSRFFGRAPPAAIATRRRRIRQHL